MTRDRRIGVWFVGALGNVATLAIVGARAMRREPALRVGLVTDLPEFAALELSDPADFVFGGCDIRRGTVQDAAREFARQNGVIDPAWIEGVETTIVPGVPHGGGAAIERMADSVAPARTNADILRWTQQQVRAFQELHKLDEVVVVNVASAEARAAGLPDDILDPATPASVLYAYAAVDAGFPYVNFASSVGSSHPTVDKRARERGVPHMGRDGKTGETLLKTVLAPMFAARNLRVLAWEGHNILGNRDGEVLDVPENKAGKIDNKNGAVRAILGDASIHSNVRIDYVPSLGDWKTAWDFVHFAGFLGTKMSLQLIWQGCDSALAAPLVLDLARLAVDAKSRGLAGPMTHAACFFKAPFAVAEHDFFKQLALLHAHAAGARQNATLKSRRRPPTFQG